MRADDNFASITAAIREGRTVCIDSEKAIHFLPLRIWPRLVLGGFLLFLMTEAEKRIPGLGRPR